VVCLAVGVGWLLPAIAGGQASRPTSQPTTRPTEWKVPLKQFDHIGMVSASADGRVVSLIWTRRSPSGPPGMAGESIFCWVLDTASGKTTDMLKLLADKAKIKARHVLPARPSSNGRYLALSVLTGSRFPFKNLACLVDLKTLTVRKVAESLEVPAAWCGRHLVVSTIDAKSQAQALRRFDPATGKSEALKVHGWLAGADPKGTYLVCGCLPDALDKPAAMENVHSDKGAVALVTPGGKVLRKVMPFSELSGVPVISPAGKYVAIGRRKSERPRRPRKLLGFRVISTDGKVSRDVAGSLEPLGVTDAGDVIARVVPVGPKVKPSIEWFGADGKQRTLVDDADAGVVCGRRLFYVTTGKIPMLKCIPLK